MPERVGIVGTGILGSGVAADDLGDAQMRSCAAILEKALRVALEVANQRGLRLPGAAIASQSAEFLYALKRG